VLYHRSRGEGGFEIGENGVEWDGELTPPPYGPGGEAPKGLYTYVIEADHTAGGPYWPFMCSDTDKSQHLEISDVSFTEWEVDWENWQVNAKVGYTLSDEAPSARVRVYGPNLGCLYDSGQEQVEERTDEGENDTDEFVFDLPEPEEAYGAYWVVVDALETSAMAQEYNRDGEPKAARQGLGTHDVELYLWLWSDYYDACTGGVASEPHQCNLAAYVCYADGSPAPGAEVSFEILGNNLDENVEDNGELSAGSAMTDEYGYAEVTLTSGEYGSNDVTYREFWVTVEAALADFPETKATVDTLYWPPWAEMSFWDAENPETPVTTWPESGEVIVSTILSYGPWPVEGHVLDISFRFWTYAALDAAAQQAYGLDFDELPQEQQEEIFYSCELDYEGMGNETYGTLSDTSVETDGSGEADTVYTLGTAAGYAEFIFTAENVCIPEEGEQRAQGAQVKNGAGDWTSKVFVQQGGGGLPTYNGNYTIGTGPPPGLTWAQDPYGVETPRHQDDIIWNSLSDNADYYATHGLPNAAACLRHFLDNVEPPNGQTINFSAMIAASSTVRKLRDKELADALNFAKYLGRVYGPGVYSIVRKKAVGGRCLAGDSMDWFLAINNFQAYGSGQVTIRQGGLTGSLDFTFHLFDPYNWDADRTMDRFIHRLHKVGYAREYLNTGATASPTQTW